MCKQICLFHAVANRNSFIRFKLIPQTNVFFEWFPHCTITRPIDKLTMK